MRDDVFLKAHFKVVLLKLESALTQGETKVNFFFKIRILKYVDIWSTI